MKTCTKCQTENEQENKFCKNCRTPLFQNEEASADGNDANAHKKTKMMCPKCRMVYEKEERCVKCKGKLVPQESLDQKVEEKSDDVFEEEHASVHAAPVKQKEPASPPPERNIFKTEIPPDIRKESPPSPTFAGAAKRSLEDTFAAEAVRRSFERSSFGAAALSGYESAWRKALEKEIVIGHFARRLCGRLSDGQVEGLFHLAQTDGIIPIIRETADFDWHSGLIFALLERLSFMRHFRALKDSLGRGSLS